MIAVYNDKGCITCFADIKPNDLFENCNTIVSVGKGAIEIFNFSENNNNNTIFLNKKAKIDLNNNDNSFNNNLFTNNNITFSNGNSIDEILCIEYFDGNLFCGHSSGHISKWNPSGDNPFLCRTTCETMHKGAINKILSCEINNNKFLFTCSSDKSIKIYSKNENKIIAEKIFDEEVKDIKTIKDFSQNLNFIVSLKNGVLKVLNNSFNEIIEIPSRFKTNYTRYVLPTNNQNKKNSEGDYLLISEGNKIDVFVWIKEGTSMNHGQPQGHGPFHHGPGGFPNSGFFGSKNHP